MKVLTTQEVVELLRIGENEVRRLARSGELPCAEIGRGFLFTDQDVHAYLRAEIDKQTAARRANRGAQVVTFERRDKRSRRYAPIPELPELAG